MSENGQIIYERMSAILADVGAVGKTGRNEQQNYSFRSIDAVYNAIHPALAKHKVFCCPEVLESERFEWKTGKGTQMLSVVLKVRHRFYASDGSYVDVVTVGEGSDTGDKASNKAMSAAFKYALFMVFCIPTEEALDSEQDNPAPPARSKTRAPTKSKTVSAARMKKLHALGREIYEKDWDAKRAEIIGHVSKGKKSSATELTEAEMNEFIDGLEKKKKDVLVGLIPAPENSPLSEPTNVKPAEKSVSGDHLKRILEMARGVKTGPDYDKLSEYLTTNHSKMDLGDLDAAYGAMDDLQKFLEVQ